MFNNTEPKPYFINETCFGDDVGVWLGNKLTERGFSINGPHQEDWGWYLNVMEKSKGNVCAVNIGIASIGKFIPDPARPWHVYVTGGSGLIGWILGRSKPAHEHALDVFSKLHDIINSSSELTSCECD